MLGASVSAGRAVGSADTSSFMHLPLPTGITLGHSTPEHVKLVYFETIFEFHLTEYLLAFLSLAFQCCIAIVSHKPSPQESVTPPSRHKLRRPLCQYPLCSHALREHLPSASMWLALIPSTRTMYFSLVWSAANTHAVDGLGLLLFNVFNPMGKKHWLMEKVSGN